MNHTQFAISSMGRNISSLKKISAFITRSRQYHYVIACLSCLVGTGLLVSNLLLDQQLNLVAGLSGVVVAYAITIYSAFGARSCVQQIEKIEALEKEMEMGKRELQVLESRVAQKAATKSKAPAAATQ